MSENDLSKLEAAIIKSEKLNAEVDRRRAKLNETVPDANRKPAEVHRLTSYLKSLVKHRVDSCHWPEYGIAGKRWVLSQNERTNRHGHALGVDRKNACSSFI